jgi:hypothetical protein
MLGAIVLVTTVGAILTASGAAGVIELEDHEVAPAYSGAPVANDRYVAWRQGSDFDSIKTDTLVRSRAGGDPIRANQIPDSSFYRTSPGGFDGNRLVYSLSTDLRHNRVFIYNVNTGTRKRVRGVGNVGVPADTLTYRAYGLAGRWILFRALERGPKTPSLKLFNVRTRRAVTIEAGRDLSLASQPALVGRNVVFVRCPRGGPNAGCRVIHYDRITGVRTRIARGNNPAVTQSGVVYFTRETVPQSRQPQIIGWEDGEEWVVGTPSGCGLFDLYAAETAEGTELLYERYPLEDPEDPSSDCRDQYWDVWGALVPTASP